MNRKRQARKMKQNQISGLVLITLIIAVLAIMLSFRYADLREKQEGYAGQQAYLENLIKEEEERAEALAAQKIFVQTKQYIEQVAREKLNLVYPDEILFREDN